MPAVSRLHLTWFTGNGYSPVAIPGYPELKSPKQSQANLAKGQRMAEKDTGQATQAWQYAIKIILEYFLER